MIQKLSDQHELRVERYQGCFYSGYLDLREGALFKRKVQLTKAKAAGPAYTKIIHFSRWIRVRETAK